MITDNHPDQPTSIRAGGRFLNQSLRRAATTIGAQYSDGFGGWLVQVKKGDETARIFGYHFPLNSAVSELVATDKFAAQSILMQTGVKTIKSALVMNQNRQSWINGSDQAAAIDQAVTEIGFPAVIKPNEGTTGQSICFASNEPDLKLAIEKLLLLYPSVIMQTQIDIASEVRTIILDGQPLLQYSKIAAPGQSPPIFNLSRGAKATDIKFNRDDISGQHFSLAKQAGEALGLRLSAVDTILTQGGDVMVLEVNAGISLEKLSGQINDVSKLDKIHEQILSKSLKSHSSN